MKKFLLLALLFLAPTSAFAQCNGVFGANTVCGSVAGGPPGPTSFGSFGLVVGTTPISPSNTDVLFNNSGVLGGSSSLSFVPGGPLTITPTAASNNQGLVISQSTPSSSSVAGPITLNSLTVIDNGQTVTGGFPVDQWGQITNQTDAFRLNYRVTGGSGNHFGGNFLANVTGTNGGTTPLISSCYVNVGPITGDCWVNIAFGNVGPSGNLQQQMTGYEAEMAIADTGVALGRVGFNANSQGPTKGTNFDVAFMASLINLGTSHYSTATPWQNFIYLSNNYYGANQFPIDPTGVIILADTGTVAHFVSAHTLTVTGNVLDFPSVNITGAGSATFGTGSSATSNLVQVRCSTCGLAEIVGAANGTTGNDGLLTQDSAGTNIVFGGVFEASNTLTRFGQTAGNWGVLTANGATNVGLMVGTVTSEPLILGTNNTARMTITGAGAVTITGATSINYGAGGAGQTSLNIASTSTGFNVMEISNASSAGNTLFGVESGTPGTLYSGTSANATIFGSVNGTDTDLVTNSVVRVRIFSGGGVSIGTTTDPGIGNLLTNGFVQTNKSVVASLPTCNAGREGALYGVTDALAPAFLATIVGGGAVHTAVYCNGTNWINA